MLKNGHNSLHRSSRAHHDAQLAFVARAFLWLVTLVVGFLFVRSVPDMRRYLRIQRM